MHSLRGSNSSIQRKAEDLQRSVDAHHEEHELFVEMCSILGLDAQEDMTSLRYELLDQLKARTASASLLQSSVCDC